MGGFKALAPHTHLHTTGHTFHLNPPCPLFQTSERQAGRRSSKPYARNNSTSQSIPIPIDGNWGLVEWQSASDSSHLTQLQLHLTLISEYPYGYRLPPSPPNYFRETDLCHLSSATVACTESRQQVVWRVEKGGGGRT